MGILDNIIGGSPFLRNTQNLFGDQQPQTPGMSFRGPPAPQITPPQAPQQQAQQGPDIGTIMKIISMFGGMG